MENNNTPKDNGLELLKQVVESNVRNIEQGIKLEFALENLLNIFGETQSSIRGLDYSISVLNKTIEKETLERNQFLEKIPKSIEVKFSEDSINQLNAFEKKSKTVKYLFFGSMGILLLAILSIFSIGKLAKDWYSESVRTKSEIRLEILNEIKNDGNTIYKTSELEQLKHNTIIMNKWIQKNPKESQDFMRFKEGFESR
ncbi:hypothetical protein [Amniculibacterium aquaticum]|jgi:hypothetical protein|uniref:hypothetical protein n=1 Tax=Amniculibacterium aquaticum TaxID=2479858 RepID=UPI000F5AD2DF|nr:hypothetical protein [Amniculibacterium aquaticum]